MNNKGQGLAGWEALIILVLMGACGWVFYLYAHKPSQSQIFQKGSKPTILETHYQSSPLSCVNVKAEEFMKDKKDNRINITNSTGK